MAPESLHAGDLDSHPPTATASSPSTSFAGSDAPGSVGRVQFFANLQSVNEQKPRGVAGNGFAGHDSPLTNMAL